MVGEGRHHIGGDPARTRLDVDIDRLDVLGLHCAHGLDVAGVGLAGLGGILGAGQLALDVAREVLVAGLPPSVRVTEQQFLQLIGDLLLGLAVELHHHVHIHPATLGQGSNQCILGGLGAGGRGVRLLGALGEDRGFDG